MANGYNGALSRREVVFMQTPADVQEMATWLCKTAAKAVGVRLPPGPPAETRTRRLVAAGVQILLGTGMRVGERTEHDPIAR